MKYYRAIGEFHDYFNGWTTVENELLTEKERNTKFRYLSDLCFKIVEHPKNRTYKSFGCRFAFKED